MYIISWANFDLLKFDFLENFLKKLSWQSPRVFCWSPQVIPGLSVRLIPPPPPKKRAFFEVKSSIFGVGCYKKFGEDYSFHRTLSPYYNQLSTDIDPKPTFEISEIWNFWDFRGIRVNCLLSAICQKT